MDKHNRVDMDTSEVQWAVVRPYKAHLAQVGMGKEAVDTRIQDKWLPVENLLVFRATLYLSVTLVCGWLALSVPLSVGRNRS
jgi:hypothetical protein